MTLVIGAKDNDWRTLHYSLWFNYVSAPEGYMCSVCHVGGQEKTNFCPNCGVDMRKDGNSNG